MRFLNFGEMGGVQQERSVDKPFGNNVIILSMEIIIEITD